MNAELLIYELLSCFDSRTSRYTLDSKPLSTAWYYQSKIWSDYVWEYYCPSRLICLPDEHWIR